MVTPQATVVCPPARENSQQADAVFARLSEMRSTPFPDAKHIMGPWVSGILAALGAVDPGSNPGGPTLGT